MREQSGCLYKGEVDKDHSSRSHRGLTRWMFVRTSCGKVALPRVRVDLNLKSVSIPRPSMGLNLLYNVPWVFPACKSHLY